MVDQAKRNTLKNVAGLCAGTVGLSVSPSVFANRAGKSDAAYPIDASPIDDELTNIQFTTKISSKSNDLEVVISNTSDANAIITDMTPAQINTPRGRFDFNALFDSGYVRLSPGKSISVPIQHHAVVLDSSSIGQRVSELTDSMRRNVSVIVDGDSLAAVTIVDSANFA